MATTLIASALLAALAVVDLCLLYCLRRERDLVGWQALERQKLVVELDQAHADLEQASAPRGLERFARRTVVVNAVDGRTAWRGLLREELDDALLLEAVEVLEREPVTGKVSVEAVPGDVAIPAGKILYVQADRDA